MKALKPFRQTPGLCGPASLKILLSHYGKEFTEAELAQLCQTTAERGTDHAPLIKAAEKIGGRVIVKKEATLDDVKRFIDKNDPVIVGWWSDDGDHYSVVYDIDDTFVYLMDPQFEEGVTRIEKKTFLDIWYDFDGPESVRVDRWMMALEK
ncbi:MAG: cysteine peptidase family C39 domain-containing protein [bacterium]|nr:cysteine peptidase family C39 domain-containing protein [bacterium]